MEKVKGNFSEKEEQSKKNLKLCPAGESISHKNEIIIPTSGDSSFKHDDFNPSPRSSIKSSSEETDGCQYQNWKQFTEFPGEDRLWAPYEQGSEEKISCISETQESLSEKAALEESSNSSSGALSNMYSTLSPFIMRWSFNVNSNVDIINLTTTGAREVFFVSSHFGVIYNYNLNTMTFLPGHNHAITSVAADPSGRWLVTADAGEDTVIIIWDKKKIIPVWCLYNVFPGEGVKCVKISQDARFLAAINCNFNYVLKFWQWTYGRVEPDGSVDINPNCGKVKHIDFNHTNTEQFVITCKFNVIFCEWEKTTKKIKQFIPNFEIQHTKMGRLQESLFLDDRHTVVTSTSQGYVIVWCDVKYTKPIIEENPGTIEKHFLKEVRLHKSNITSLRLSDKIIVTSSGNGDILFHDQHFRLMYCLPNLKIEPIKCLSFNIDYVPCLSDPFSTDFMEIKEQFSFKNGKFQSIFERDIPETMDFRVLESALNKEFNENLENENRKCENPQQKDCTLDRQNFLIRDFMFLTMTGKIAYFSHERKKVKYYLHQTEAPVHAMDCNPNKSHLVVGDSQGQLNLYDYDLKKILITQKLPNKITTLKYSNLGISLMAGLENGELYELDPLLLTVKIKLETSKKSIMKLCFSYNDNFLAFYDQISNVQVYRAKSLNNEWISMGKCNFHYKPIVDILFKERLENSKYSRLFTIGQDRMLMEYNIKDSEENKLSLLTSVRIEQTAIPCCFTWLDDFYKSPHFLISNDQYKLKVVDANTYVCKKTTVGPSADTPINWMKLIKDSTKPLSKAKMIYTTEKHIGIKLLPATGNPFEGMGMIADPDKLVAIAKSYDDKYIFTVGVNSTNPLMWEINPSSVEVSLNLGGIELEPFLTLIEGGANSFLMREMEDSFYYAQIIHQGEDPNIDRSISKNLALCEIPDLFRALGYFPTDHEVENILYELKYLDYEKTGEIRTEITFEEYVKAFLNHRPVNEITVSDIHKALLTIADASNSIDTLIERNTFYKALEESAEGMEHAEVIGYLCILLQPKDENNPLPQSMKISEIMEQVFGIDFTITEDNVRNVTHASEKEN